MQLPQKTDVGELLVSRKRLQSCNVESVINKKNST